METLTMIPYGSILQLFIMVKKIYAINFSIEFSIFKYFFNQRAFKTSSVLFKCIKKGKTLYKNSMTLSFQNPMVSQPQSQQHNSIESPANLLQQQHNFDVQVSIKYKYSSFLIPLRVISMKDTVMCPLTTLTLLHPFHYFIIIIWINLGRLKSWQVARAHLSLI